jgi:voltage-gated potassium channel
MNKSRTIQFSPASVGGRKRTWRHLWQTRIAWPILVLLSFILVASLGYYLIEKDYSWADAIYMTFITISTVGYGEVHPLHGWGRVWTMGVLGTGLVLGTIVMSSLVAMLVEGQLLGVLGRRQLQRKIAGLKEHIVVCGYGNAGSVVAHQLKSAGRDVVVVETDSARTTAAGQDGMLYVLGDAQDEGVLKSAGIEAAAYLVAALPTDAENVFVTLSARQLRPDIQIIVRSNLPSSQDKLIKAGADQVICPLTICATRMVDVIIRPAVVDFVDMARMGVNLEMEQLRLGQASALVGKTLSELALPQKIGVQVVAIQRSDGTAIYHPTAEFRLKAGDIMVLVGQRGAAAAVQELEPQA